MNKCPQIHSEKDNVLRIEVFAIRGDWAHLNIRIRAEDGWLHYEDVRLLTGDIIAFYDRQEAEAAVYEDGSPFPLRFYKTLKEWV